MFVDQSNCSARPAGIIEDFSSSNKRVVLKCLSLHEFRKKLKLGWLKKHFLERSRINLLEASVINFLFFKVQGLLISHFELPKLSSFLIVLSLDWSESKFWWIFLIKSFFEWWLVGFKLWNGCALCNSAVFAVIFESGVFSKYWTKKVYLSLTMLSLMKNIKVAINWSP